MLARRLAQPLRRVGARTSATDGRAAAQATLDSPGRQRLVVALGGNALLKRGHPLTFANQMAAAKEAAPKLVELSKKHEVILVHGNGPQVGILALMEQDYSASTGTTPYTFDCLGAETQGQIGYVLTSAVLNVPDNKGACTIVTEVLVDKDDPAFAAPTKPVGALYTKEEADQKEVRGPPRPMPPVPFAGAGLSGAARAGGAGLGCGGGRRPLPPRGPLPAAAVHPPDRADQGHARRERLPCRVLRWGRGADGAHGGGSAGGGGGRHRQGPLLLPPRTAGPPPSPHPPTPNGAPQPSRWYGCSWVRTG